MKPFGETLNYVLAQSKSWSRLDFFFSKWDLEFFIWLFKLWSAMKKKWLTMGSGSVAGLLPASAKTDTKHTRLVNNLWHKETVYYRPGVTTTTHKRDAFFISNHNPSILSSHVVTLHMQPIHGTLADTSQFAQKRHLGSHSVDRTDWQARIALNFGYHDEMHTGSIYGTVICQSCGDQLQFPNSVCRLWGNLPLALHELAHRTSIYHSVHLPKMKLALANPEQGQARHNRAECWQLTQKKKECYRLLGL